MTSTQTNTWPPLISGASTDTLQRMQLLGDSVLASALIQANEPDPFFFPAQTGLTGFGCDGIAYVRGVPGAGRASWWSESFGPFRGSSANFPMAALVLATDAGISVIDITTGYETWMVFQRGDTFAFANNYRGIEAGYTPSSITYCAGRILVGLEPDPGSASMANAFVTFDFLIDKVYLDTPYYATPALGLYSTPAATYPVGAPIAPNTPTTTGGAILGWGITPNLPMGLVLDQSSGIISGTPLTSSAQTSYTVTAMNQEGSASTVLSIITE